jgi:cytochrome c-type biogenesis protein CcmE
VGASGQHTLGRELAHKDNTSPVPVAYRGILPDMFAEGREVVVEGRYQDGGLSARQIMTSCPSKYEAAPAEATAAPAQGSARPAGAS